MLQASSIQNQIKVVKLVTNIQVSLETVPNDTITYNNFKTSFTTVVWSQSAHIIVLHFKSARPRIQESRHCIGFSLVAKCPCQVSCANGARIGVGHL